MQGRLARHYDLLMDLLLLGRYQSFIEQAIGRMAIRADDAVLDLGSGSGRNACLMLKALGPAGRLVGVDIGDQMLRQARRRCRGFPQVRFVQRRIEMPLPFQECFDHVFISFTLHGFEDEDKQRVIANAWRALKMGGMFWILDYNSFDLERQLPPFRWAFRRLECPLASEFLRLDLEKMLDRQGFGRFVQKLFLKDYVRLLGAAKLGSPPIVSAPEHQCAGRPSTIRKGEKR